jgi:putative endonuclease
MRYFVYILWSSKLSKFYIGTTTEPDRRLEEHNNRIYKNAFSAKGLPWEFFLSIECKTSEHAYALERFLKQMKSSQFLKKLGSDPNLVQELLLRFERGEIGIPKLRERRT